MVKALLDKGMIKMTVKNASSRARTRQAHPESTGFVTHGRMHRPPCFVAALNPKKRNKIAFDDKMKRVLTRQSYQCEGGWGYGSKGFDTEF